MFIEFYRFGRSEGVQVGPVQSTFGVLGTWTTVFHDEGDPVGMYLIISRFLIRASNFIIFRSVLATKGSGYRIDKYLRC